MLRLIHTADWHLGHRLKDFERVAEHERFLGWLLEQVGQQEADALLVAGDIFDSANPPAAALRMWYGFLGEARARYPALQIVAIGGNHDSAARLDAPRALLQPLGVQVLGGAPLSPAGGLDAAAMALPLRGRDGQVAAVVAAVPFLSPFELHLAGGGGAADDALALGLRACYGQVLGYARQRLGPGQALLAMGHLHLSGAQLSELSERKILSGGLHAVGPDLFDPGVAYVALGHLHLAQPVGRAGVRYAGSPIPLSMAERRYPHQVLRVDLQGPELAGVHPLPVPRAVDLLRVPEGGHAPLPEVCAALQALRLPPPAPGLPPAFLEVGVCLQGPEPGLRAAVEQAVGELPVRLVKISTELAGHGRALAEASAARTLDELAPAVVLRQCWAARHPGEPPAELLQAFAELLAQVQAGGER